jgi:hypothetical protein
MFEIYLNNLYKNLNLYNIHNIKKYTNFYKNKIHNMNGGNEDIANINLIKLRELSTKLKSDMEDFKQKLTSNNNSDYIKIKKETFQLMKDLFEYTTKEIIRDHNIVKQDIDKMYDTLQSQKFNQISETINEINKTFTELLS